jgi:hypothetical protein
MMMSLATQFVFVFFVYSMFVCFFKKKEIIRGPHLFGEGIFIGHVQFAAR